jgi:hypothetical protein
MDSALAESATGAGVSAFGVLILAIRRPERSERIE